jgi:hypothetical protein
MQRKHITYIIHTFVLLSFCLLCHGQAHALSLPLQAWNSELSEFETREKDEGSSSGFPLIDGPHGLSDTFTRPASMTSHGKMDCREYPRLSFDPQTAIHAPPLRL